jgi:release factor glutamine methyltransferase
MPNSKTLFTELVSQIQLKESKEEIDQIVLRLLEKKLNLSSTDILFGKEVSIKEEEFKPFIERINRHEPIQYILNEEYFYGRKFFVDSSVLIPRPETEELVGEILTLFKDRRDILIFDIGTGSGCIAITLAEEIPTATVWATDISETALAVANRNADLLNAKVNFLKHDILSEDLHHDRLDLIVSNPPYISENEKNQMQHNVLNYEPHAALFAPGPDPLIFYKRIATNAQLKLKNEGIVAVEINEHFAPEIASIFGESGLKEIQVRKDITGKSRFIIALKK